MRPTTAVRRLLAAVVVCGAAAMPVTTPAGAETFPTRIDLPDGFRPEGIAVGRGTTFYVGSIPTGALYRGDLRTGDGGVLTPPSDGAAAIGLAVDGRERVFVAGGPTGRPA